MPARRLQNESRRRRLDIASKTSPNFINPLIQRAESGMEASVVKAEQIEK
jgi:hypothetical protein